VQISHPTRFTNVCAPAPGPIKTSPPETCEDASIAIETLEVLAGSLPDRALRLVREWAELHRLELEADWELARSAQPLERIPPLA
jgi:hypothetical protein